MSKSDLVIAIDGPAGAGKSTVAKLLAARYGLSFLDTGAMYRAVALKASRKGINGGDQAAVAELCASSDIAFAPGDPQRVFLDGEDVTLQIREPSIGNLASEISVLSEVRRLLVSRQKEIVSQGSVTLEGRDTTTVIAPEAPIRVFLTASLQERSKRRFVELQQKGLSPDFDDLREQIAQRDHRDSSREDSPLHVAPGVVVIDTDGLSIDQVIEEISALVLAWKG